MSTTEPIKKARKARLITHASVTQAARVSGTSVAGKQVINNCSKDKNYDPAGDLTAPAVRVGADDGLAIPSRFDNRLHYRDGRVTSA